MAKKLKIVMVGFQLLSQEVDFVGFEEKRSLLEWDIVIFRTGFEHDNDDFNLQDSDYFDFDLEEACAYWRQQIDLAMNSGITALVYLDSPYFVYYSPVNDIFSRKAVSNYSFLPVDTNSSPTHGKDMVLHGVYQSRFASYWKQFGNRSSYEVILPDEIGAPYIVTKRGAKPVGAVLKDEKSGGLLLLLPHLHFDGLRCVVNINSLSINFSAAISGKLSSCTKPLEVSLTRRRRPPG